MAETVLNTEEPMLDGKSPSALEAELDDLAELFFSLASAVGVVADKIITLERRMDDFNSRASHKI